MRMRNKLLHFLELISWKKTNQPEKNIMENMWWDYAPIFCQY